MSSGMDSSSTGEKEKQPQTGGETMAARKLRAWREGKLPTDVVFLVGTDDQSAKEVVAMKSDLTVGSEYFSRLLSSTWTAPCNRQIRLKTIEVDTFCWVVEFCTLSGQLVSKVADLESCLRLARAADEFLIQELSFLCVTLLEKEFLRVENVWSVLSENHQFQTIRSSCLKLLSMRTSECLANETFLSASKEAISLFMALDEQLNVDSEVDLMRACLSYSKSQDDPWETFQQYFLPKLRLLALSMDEIQEVNPMLTSQEVTFLATYRLVPELRQSLEPVPGLCLIETNRTDASIHTLILIPESKVLDMKDVFLDVGAYESLADLEFTLTLRAIRSFIVQSFEFFCDIDVNANYYLDRAWQQKLNSSRSYETKDALTISSSVQSVGKFCARTCEIPLPAVLQANTWRRIEHFAIVPAGATFKLTATLKGEHVLRNIIVQDKDIRSFNEPGNAECLKKFHSIETTATQKVVGARESQNNRYCGIRLFKNISYADVKG